MDCVCVCICVFVHEETPLRPQTLHCRRSANYELSMASHMQLFLPVTGMKRINGIITLRNTNK